LKPQTQDSRETWRDLIALTLATLVLFGLGLGARDLWNPNEPTYGRVVVEILESGDWLLPKLSGEVFAEKPILYYWLGAVSSLVAGGASETALRAPQCLAGIASTLLTYLLIAGYLGRRRALIGAAIFATEYLVWWTSRTVQMDIFVLLSTLATTLALTRLLDGSWTGRRAWLVAGLSAGLGFAAKGPVTSLVPAMIVVGYCVVARRPWRRLFSGLPWGLAVFALTGLPWYLALLAGGHGDALRELLLRQNFSRFVEAWDHNQPWWYFLEYFWISYAPWSWFVPIAAFLRNLDADERRAHHLAWVWILAPILFFSLADSKREPYILPIAPAIALLAAAGIDRFVAADLSRNQRRAAIGVFAFFAAILLAASVYAGLSGDDLPPEISPPILIATLSIGGLAVAGALASSSRWRWAPPSALAAAMLLIFVMGSLHLFPSGNATKSHRAFAAEANVLVPDDARLFGFFGGGNRKWQRGGGYAYYMRRPVPHLDGESRLGQAWATGEPTCVITEDDLYDDVIAAAPPTAAVVLEAPIGSKLARLVCSDAVGSREGLSPDS
jgi:4-amino-4-deoxy-L-arabinose transferase-like glycosyltransferase